MPRVVHFEIHAESPERAVRFYESAFGWRAAKWDGRQDYWLLTTGSAGESGIDGAIVRRRGSAPAEGAATNAFVCTIEVPVLDIFMDNVRRHGGAIVVPKAAIPGIGWLAYGRDTEGNVFGLMQNDAGAQ